MPTIPPKCYLTCISHCMYAPVRGEEDHMRSPPGSRIGCVDWLSCQFNSIRREAAPAWRCVLHAQKTRSELPAPDRTDGSM
jgi:hypothetical protein